MHNIAPKYWGLILLISLIWGASFLAMAVGLQAFGPLTIAAYRVTIAAAALILLARWRGVGLPPLSNGWVWLAALGLGLFSNALPFSLLAWAQQEVTSGFAGVTMAAVPLMTLPLAHAFVAEDRMSPLKTFGLLLGFIGVVVLIGPEAFRASGGAWEPIARLACFASAACYAVGNIIARRAPAVHAYSLAAAALVCASVTSLPVALLLEGVPTVWPAVPSLALLYLGVFPTAVAVLIQLAVVRGAGPTFMTLSNYLVPVWAVAFGLLILAEPLPDGLLLALMLILSGVAIAQFRSLRALFRSPPAKA